MKNLGRAACERRMALIVDDTVDVWPYDLSNLCITRRFVGDQLDDGLQLLSWQLSEAHRAFYAAAPAEGYSLVADAAVAAADPDAAPSPRAPPSIYSVLADARGQLLRGCVIALTGVVNGLGHEDGLEALPLGVLIRLYGGETTTSLDAATHLVARRKDGWQNSPKIKRALARLQARPASLAPLPCVPPCCHGAATPPRPPHTSRRRRRRRPRAASVVASCLSAPARYFEEESTAGELYCAGARTWRRRAVRGPARSRPRRSSHASADQWTTARG